MTGAMGHKPSYGIVPAHGRIPGPAGTLTQSDLAVAGPMARSVGDHELGLQILASGAGRIRKATG
jgi:amidase